MTVSEVLTTVEESLTKIGLKDRFGQQLVGLEAVCVLNKYNPAELKRLEDDLENGGEPLRYLDGMLRLIRAFRQYRLDQVRSRMNAEVECPKN